MVWELVYRIITIAKNSFLCYNVSGTVIPFSVLPDLGSKWIKADEKESIIERGMRMKDNIFNLIISVFEMFKKISITVKLPLINFSFAPLIFMPRGYHTEILPMRIRGDFYL